MCRHVDCKTALPYRKGVGEKWGGGVEEEGQVLCFLSNWFYHYNSN